MRASSAAHSVQRLIELFPPIDQGQVRHALGSTLRGIVNQRLLERADGRGRIPAVQVLVGTSKVAEAVADPVNQTPLDQLIAEGQYHGMQHPDEALLELVRDGKGSLLDALTASPNPEAQRKQLGSGGIP